MSIVALTLVCLFAAAAPEASQSLSVAEVLARVRSLDPLLAQRAAERTRAEIALHRAEWNRISGTLGINASEAGFQAGLLGSKAIDPIEREFHDRFTAGIAADVAVPLYAGGGLSAAIEAREARFQAAQADYQRTRQDLEQAALKLYAALLAADERLRISTFAAERAGQVLDIAQKRSDAGVGNEADVVRALVNKVNQYDALTSAKGDRQAVVVALAAALSLEPSASLVAQDNWSKLLGSSDSAPAAPLLELQTLAAIKRAAGAERRAAFAGFLPRLELFGNAAYSNAAIFRLTGVPTNFASNNDRLGVFAINYTVGVRLSWLAWDFFVTRDSVATAEADAARASAALATEQRDASRRLADARTRESVARERLAALAEGSAAAERAVSLARSRYESGNSSLTDVLSAELDAVSVELRVVQAHLEAAQGQIDRTRAEGREFMASQESAP